MTKAGKFHNKNFNVEALKKLYEVGMEYIKMREQWLGMNSYQHACGYALKAEAIAELMESVTVFHHGDGADAFANMMAKKKSVDERIKSFEGYWK